MAATLTAYDRAVKEPVMADPLPPEVVDRLAAFVERDDLERMRVVTGAPGAWIPLALGTGAVVVGNRAFFRHGRYDPTTPKGLALIAHESRHVGQYAQLGVPRFLWRYAVGAIRVGFRHGRHPMEMPLITEQQSIRDALEHA